MRTMTVDGAIMLPGNATHAGWFAIRPYPDCSVLVYRTFNYFTAEILDFGWSSSGGSPEEAFRGVMEIALKNFRDQSSVRLRGPGYWSRHGEIALTGKIGAWRSESPFWVVDDDELSWLFDADGRACLP